MTTRTHSRFTDPVADHIWHIKYRCQQDACIEDSWRRVAAAVAAREQDADLWQQKFYDILEGFRFLPGGRILAGAGTDLHVTLFNCFVMGTIRDDLESIFQHLKEAALTMQAGGGVGVDFSTLRPKGCLARATHNVASGPVSFMHIWNAMCATMLSTGARRGAMMATLRCDHPDIEEFINAKRSPGVLQHFNLSVQVTDDFMHAVEHHEQWPLVFPLRSISETVTGQEIVMRQWPGHDGEIPCVVMARKPAAELWLAMMRAAYDTAEPGVLFVDRINRQNNLHYCEQISCTNPCGEIPLPPYGACDLGSINLTAFVHRPFSKTATVDFSAIAEVTAVAVRFLDNVLDCSEFPLQAQKEQVLASRRIGLGVTGLADTLIMLGLHYGTAKARKMAVRIMTAICHTAYRCSAALAQEKGTFPLYQRDAFLQSHFIQGLPSAIQALVARHGLRNSHLMALAPAGTISLLANNVSSGIEPVYGFTATRRILDLSGEYREFQLQDYAWQCWQERKGNRPVPGCFVSATDLTPRQHLLMQGVLQPLVDNAISKTVNVPEDFPFARFVELYTFAYQQGLKGCTVFRPNTGTGTVLRKSSGHSLP